MDQPRTCSFVPGNRPERFAKALTSDADEPVLDFEPAVADNAKVRARHQGFGAKLCIHPRQVAPIHAAPAPSAQALDWARQVLAADAASTAAARLVGQTVDRPVLLRAQRLLRMAGH